jgi:CDP-diacylglycerol--glycerol-3-phosphate 3-phosphatidyltransferase
VDSNRSESLPAGEPDVAAAASFTRTINLPNLLSGIRFLGSFVLVGLAMAGGGPVVLPLIVVLLMTDWIDGKLAILLNQRTTFGARLDSLADVTFYVAVLIALCWLKSDLVIGEVNWIWPAIVAYGTSCLVGLMKFGRIPTYHTRGAKTAWLLATLAILLVFAKGWVWPLRFVGAWVFLVNIEAILITLTLPKAQVDIATLYHAVRARRETPASPDWTHDSRGPPRP